MSVMSLCLTCKNIKICKIYDYHKSLDVKLSLSQCSEYTHGYNSPGSVDSLPAMPDVNPGLGHANRESLVEANEQRSFEEIYNISELIRKSDEEEKEVEQDEEKVKTAECHSCGAEEHIDFLKKCSQGEKCEEPEDSLYCEGCIVTLPDKSSMCSSCF